jgi:hypothetical protein
LTETPVKRTAELLLELDEELDVAIVDLSAGRSHATEIVLAATARLELRRVPARWLVFHRWTSQHIIAAHGLVEGGAASSTRPSTVDTPRPTSGARSASSGPPSSTPTPRATPGSGPNRSPGCASAMWPCISWPDGKQPRSSI